MRAKRFIIATLAVVGLTATAGSAFAWFGHRGGHAHAKIKTFIDWRINDVLDDIEANTAQRDRVNAIKARMFEAAEGFAKSRPETRKAFLAQWNAATVDKAEVHRLIDERIDEIRAMAHQAADAAIEVHGTLDPTQRAAITKMITDRWGE